MSLPPPTATNRAVVTGASSGIGEALAAELAARGYSFILVARRDNLLDALAQRLRGAHGVEAEVRAVDLSDRTTRQALVAELADREIAILCNNAGIATFGPVSAQDPAGERAQVELNAVAVHDLTLAVLPGMLARGAGAILFSGSAAGNMPIPNNATYAATKAFVNSFSESLRGEVAGGGVHVTLLAPGPVAARYPTRRTRPSSTAWSPAFSGWTPSRPRERRWMPWRRTRCASCPAYSARRCRPPASTPRAP